jgi:hypothetical protein
LVSALFYQAIFALGPARAFAKETVPLIMRALALIVGVLQLGI